MKNISKALAAAALSFALLLPLTHTAEACSAQPDGSCSGACLSISKQCTAHIALPDLNNTEIGFTCTDLGNATARAVKIVSREGKELNDVEVSSENLSLRDGLQSGKGFGPEYQSWCSCDSIYQP